LKRVEVRIDDPALAGLRLDRFISERLGLFSRSQLAGRVRGLTVNGAPARQSRRLRVGDLVAVEYDDPAPLHVQAEPIPLAVIFENGDVIVVDKPQGMVVHPGNGNRSGTLLNALLARRPGLAAAWGPDEARPGIVHRLDKDTSGVMVAAANPAAHEALARQFKNREVRKRYLAIVRGAPPAGEGRIEVPLVRSRRDRRRFVGVRARAPGSRGGRAAVTRYRVLRRWPGYALVLLVPLTGRTHQLRVHLRLVGCPVLGDPLYGRPDPRFPSATLMLHSWRLAIRLPGEAEPREFRAPLPERFRQVIRALRASGRAAG
jgi:23S rRNA pseudouridine1911/1915/1917 synthase